MYAFDEHMISFSHTYIEAERKQDTDRERERKDEF